MQIKGEEVNGTTDFNAIHVVTPAPVNGQLVRIASYKGSEYADALARMAEYARESGRVAWLVRGTAA
jgi:hypothetical protein